MGKGRSGATGASVNANTSGGASFRTAELVKDAIEAKQDGTLREVRTALDKIREGQKISTYSAEFDGVNEVKGVANDPVVWEKMDDGTWRGDNGRRIDNSDLARRVYNAGFGRKLAAGEVTTESHLDVPSKGGRTIDGLKFVGGTYDIQSRGTKVGTDGPRKFERKGNITTYNGTMYGATMDGGEYTITHIPTGLSVGAKGVKSMKGVSQFIKSIDGTVKNIRGLDDMERRFNKMIRGD